MIDTTCVPSLLRPRPHAKKEETPTLLGHQLFSFFLPPPQHHSCEFIDAAWHFPLDGLFVDIFTDRGQSFHEACSDKE